MGVDIDKLNIEVSTNAGKVAKEIDKVSKAMEKLKQSLENTGLPRLCNQLKKLKETAQELSGLNAYTEKVAKFSESIHKLSGLKIPSVSKMTARVKELVDMSKEMSSFTGADELAEKVNQICSAMKPMESMGKNTLAPFISSMKKIPEFTKSMDTKTMQDFKNMIKEITSAIQPLITQVSKSEKGLVSLNRIIQSTVSSNGNLAASNAAAVKNYTSVLRILTSTKAKLLAYSYAVLRVTRVLKDWLDLSNDYIENLNLFEVAMGKGAKEALNYAESVNKALGIDVSDWIRNQGVFKQVTSGFGVLNDTSDIMSKNLTQLGYDISSFFNIDVDESMQKLQSGISGEIEPLRRLGYALDQTTLQQIAYSNGITMNINKMTQAQKSQLRYIAILQQSKNVTGDMARTVTTPANAMRILDQQINQLKRSIGNIISIVVQKLLPYIQAFVRLLGDAADYLAKLWGFELPNIDYSNVGNGLSNISDEADNATDSVKKTAKEMQRLAGFDELNILSSKDNSNSDNSNISNGFDLGIQMPEYDFLSGLDNQSDSVYKKMKEKALELVDWIKENKRLVELLGIAIGVAFAVKKIKKFFDLIGGLSIFKTAKTWVKRFMDGFKNSTAIKTLDKIKDGLKNIQSYLGPGGKLIVGLGGGIIGGFLGYDFMKNLIDGTLDWKKALFDVGGITATIAASFAIGGPIAGGIAILGTLIGMAAAIKPNYDTLYTIFDNGGVKVSTLTGEFKDQYDKVIKTSQKVDEYATRINETKEKIGPAYKKLSDFNGSLSAFNKKLTNNDITELKEKLEIISQGIKDNLGYASQSIIDTFKQKVHAVGENSGVDLDKVVEAVQNFEKKLSGVTDSAQQTINEFWDKKANREVVTNQDKENFEKAMEFFRLEAERTSKEIKAEKEAMQKALDWSKVDFENPTDFKNALGDYKKQYQEAEKSINNIFDTNKNNLDEMLGTAKSALKAETISKKEYKELKDNYDYILKQLEKDRDASLKDLTIDGEAFSGALISQYNQHVNDLAVEYVKNRYSYMGQEEFRKWKKNHANEYAEALAEEKRSIINQTPELSEAITQMTKDLKITPNVALGEEWKKYLAANEEFVRPSTIKGVKNIVKGIDKTARYSLGEIDLTNEAKNMWEPIITEGNNVTNGIEETFNKLDSHFKELSKHFSKAEMEAQETFQKSSVSLAEIYAASPELYIRYGSVNGQSHSSKVPGYASGGFPTSGQLFYARENGIPEMVGKIGNQTAVANNNQIEKGIADAVYKAVTSATGSSVASNNQPINITVPVYIDGQKMDEQQYNYRQRQLVRSNGRREY